MNRQLRKRHRAAWFFIAGSLPFLFLASWLVIPQLEPVKAIANSQPEPLPVILKTIVRTQFEIQLQTNKNGDLQLEWWNKTALHVPSAVIYRVNANGQQFLVGRIEARGRYRFPLQKDSTASEFHFQLYDFIHEQIIDTINFSL